MRKKKNEKEILKSFIREIIFMRTRWVDYMLNFELYDLLDEKDKDFLSKLNNAIIEYEVTKEKK